MKNIVLGGLINDALFPGAASYRSFGHAYGLCLRERSRDGLLFPYTERHLQCVWHDPLFRPRKLQTEQGEPVTVEHPGIWNLEEGPDFRGAVIRVGRGRRLVTGDVELHVRPNDWKQHGHQGDPRYAGVCLHVTYVPGLLPAGLLPPGALQLSLREPLRNSSSFSFEAIDVTAYPYAIRPDRPPCSAWFGRAAPDAIIRVLNAAGEERLKRKAERMALAIQEKGVDQALYEEVMCALGYKHNKQAFRLLAERMPLEQVRSWSRGDAQRAYALLAGASGLLPRRIAPSWDGETKAYVRALWDIWWKEKSRRPEAFADEIRWRRSGGRPANHPARRLMAAAELFTRPVGLASTWLSLARGKPDTCLKEARRRFDGWTDTYWCRRLAWGGPIQPAGITLLGPNRVTAILINIFIPFLAAQGCKAPFRKKVLEQLPAEANNSLIRQTAFTLFGPDHTATFYRSGLCRQGLLQIFHDFCLNDRSRCASCVFPGALREMEQPRHLVFDRPPQRVYHCLQCLRH